MREHDPAWLPLTGISLVEASAGTGKTFTLAGLYLRLLIERRMEVRDVLVMTFTRAATQELRERIRARVAEAAQLATDPASAGRRPESAFALEVIERSDEPREQLAARLREAAVRMDEATIVTIHGYAGRALQEHAFEGGVAFDRGDQVDERSLIDEAAADWWRQQIFGGDPRRAEEIRALWATPDALAKGIGELLTRPWIRLAGPDLPELRRRQDTALATWMTHAGVLRDWLLEVEQKEEFHNRGLLFKAIKAAGGAAPFWDGLDAHVRQSAARSMPGIMGKLSVEAVPGQIKGTARKSGMPAEAADVVSALEAAVAAVPFEHWHRARSEIAALLARRKRERRVHTFADLVEALHDAMVDPERGPGLSKALARRWPFALVDEFQDTDPLQYAILRRIYAGRAGTGLVMIGDPKQAIYGFRGGDVFAYLAAAEDATEKRGLTSNFRSTAEVLQAIETVFTATPEPFLVRDIDFVPVKPGRPAGDRRIELGGKTLPAMEFWLVPETEGGDHKLATVGSVRERLTGAAVAEVVRLLDPASDARVLEGPESRALAPGDICLLVNRRREAAELQQRLAVAGIPAVCIQQDSVFASREATEMEAVLAAAATPADAQRIRRALMGELFGLRLGELLALEHDDEAWQGWVDQLQQAHERWLNDGVLAMLEPLLQAAAPRLLGLADGERRLTNWLHLAESLQEAESSCFGPAGLQRWLAGQRARADSRRRDDEAQLRLESDEALVRIATVHAVKGLQFPVVLLPYAPFLGTAHNQGVPGRPPVRWHEADGGEWFAPGPAVEAAHQAQAIREHRAEAVRLLYVALTRAEQAIMLPWCRANGVQNSALAWVLHGADGASGDSWETASNALRWFTPEVVASRLAALEQAGGGSIRVRELPGTGVPSRSITGASASLAPAREDFPSLRVPWRMLSYSALLRGEGPVTAEAGGRDDEAGALTASTEALSQGAGSALETAAGSQNFEWAALEGLGGSAFGSAVHDLLEQAAFAEWSAPGELPTPAQRRQVAEQLRRQGVVLAGGAAGERQLLAVAGLVSRGLHTPLPDLGALAGVPADRRLAEMGFVMRLGGASPTAVGALLERHGYTGLPAGARAAGTLQGLMQGFIDLVVEHQGRYWVLDYKTNRLGSGAADYAPTRLAEAVRRGHYDLQYLIYLVALHRHLRVHLADYQPSVHLGGAQYLFLRGMNGRDAATGVFVDRPAPGLIESLDRLFDAEAAA